MESAKEKIEKAISQMNDCCEIKFHHKAPNRIGVIIRQALQAGRFAVNELEELKKLAEGMACEMEFDNRPTRQDRNPIQPFSLENFRAKYPKET